METRNLAHASWLLFASDPFRDVRATSPVGSARLHRIARDQNGRLNTASVTATRTGMQASTSCGLATPGGPDSTLWAECRAALQSVPAPPLIPPASSASGGPAAP